ncbi:MAG: penicillin-binding protein 2 [Porphyromonas sp.]|nr:penicillin-binding protein 2 [Porphyromonas sp.]
MRKNKNRYSYRQAYLSFIMILVVVVYLVRLFYIQVLSPEYKAAASDIAFFNKTLYPARGMIYDCKGRLVVYNQATANVQIITREMQPFDTLEFCNIFGIEPEYLRERLEKIKDRNLNKGYSPYTLQQLISQVTPEEASAFEELLYKYPGFYVEHYTTRDYNYPSGALLLGYVAEVSQEDIDGDSYYVPRDHIGKTGIERSYERFLRGEKGNSVLLRDAHGRIKGQYLSGEKDEDLQSGHDLELSIDIDLQTYAEQLMQGKRGSVVMIKPKTGEVRAMVSSPSFDPELLNGRKRGENYKRLEQDPHKPLFNRAVMGTYPPGSTFKPVQAAVFLQEGAINGQQSFPCHFGYPPLGNRPRCHGHPSPVSLAPALATSCNAYFCWGLRALLDDRSLYQSAGSAFEVWKDHIVDLGFGYRLGIDLPSESRGYIPNTEVYNKIYGEGRWSSSTIISISIGQGEILATPLQIANFAATVANRGSYYTPHVVRKISDLPTDSLNIRYHQTGIASKHFDEIDAGMRMAVTSGTCRRANLPGYAVCAKTGTSENVHGKDHSLFIAYAPQDDPKIAIAVIVENAGFGATYALPIGRILLEYYLNDGIITEETEQYESAMLATKLL